MSNDIRQATEIIRLYEERGEITSEDFDNILDHYLETIKDGYAVDVEDLIRNHIRARKMDARGKDPDHPVPGLAGVLDRATAGLADGGFLVVLHAIFMKAIQSIAEPLGWSVSSNWKAHVALFALLGWVYFTSQEHSRWMASLGKRLLGLRVVNMRGYRLNHFRLTARYLLNVVCLGTAGLGYLLLLTNKRRQGLHDVVTGAQVVNRDYVAARGRSEEQPDVSIT